MGVRLSKGLVFSRWFYLLRTVRLLKVFEKSRYLLEPGSDMGVIPGNPINDEREAGKS